MTDDLRRLRAAVARASTAPAGSVERTLADELARRDAADRPGPWAYRPMPADRPHPCYEPNLAGVPVAWLEHDPRYGWALVGTDVYGDGTSCDGLRFCPWCGVRLSEGGAPC